MRKYNFDLRTLFTNPKQLNVTRIELEDQKNSFETVVLVQYSFWPMILKG